MTRILCFGDSITQGYSDELGGWTQRMRQYLDSKYISHFADIEVATHGVFNLGISADTSADLLKRFKNEIEARVSNENTIIVIAIGTNDTIYEHNIENANFTHEQFENNLEQLIAQGKEFTEKIVLVGILPCEEDKMQPMPWSTTGESYSNERLREFNEIIIKKAQEHNLPMIDLFDKVLQEGPSKYLADGLHPNSEGHTLIAFETQFAVEKLL